MRSRSLALTLITSLSMSGQLALACANYSQTELDDLAVRRALATNDERAYRLVSRQFPHHGRAYWVALEGESRARLGRSDDGSLGAEDDLAVALLKQGRFDEARALLQELDRGKPGRYRTLSNLGVLEKKAGNYGLAASYLERALRARPGGHMGLGDYYLRAARWQGEATRVTPRADFLGRSYAAPIASANVDRTYLETLIHNDREFPDVYLVYGDLLLTEDQPLLAGYAYAQARRLGHPADKVLDGRFERLREVMSERSERERASSPIRAVSEEGDRGVKSLPKIVSSEELEAALTHWLQRFDAYERAFEERQEQLLAGGTQSAGLNTVNEGLAVQILEPGVAIHYLVEREKEAKPALAQVAETSTGVGLGLLAALLLGGLTYRLRRRSPG